MQTNPKPDTNTNANSTVRALHDELDQTNAALQKAATDTANQLADSAHAVKRQVSASAHEAGDVASREAGRIVEMVRQWIERQTASVKDTVKDTAGAVSEQAAAAADRTQRYVKEEPIKGLLLAAAAGALVTGMVILATRYNRDH